MLEILNFMFYCKAQGYKILRYHLSLMFSIHCYLQNIKQSRYEENTICAKYFKLIDSLYILAFNFNWQTNLNAQQ